MTDDRESTWIIVVYPKPKANYSAWLMGPSVYGPFESKQSAMVFLLDLSIGDTWTSSVHEVFRPVVSASRCQA